MSSACLLLATLTLLAVPPAGHDKTDDDARATLRQVATMTPPQQQAWLRQLKARLDWANRLTLSPEEAARQNARVTDLLQQKQVSFQTALELVRQRNLREKDAVEHLVQKYRGQVYQTFQGEGPAFTERQEAWYRVWGLWQSAGSPADQQDRLMTWLETAIRNSMPGKVSPLPADPTFTPREPAAGQAGKKPLSAKLVETVKTSEELSKKSGKTAKKSEEPSKKAGDTAKKPEKPAKRKPDEVFKTTEPAKQPEESVKKPAESVKQPEETIKEPAEPAKQPEETIKEPADAVKKPEQTIKKPAESVKKPADTSEKPTGVVKKPGETSKISKPPAEDRYAPSATVVWHPVELPRLSGPALAVPEPDRPSPSLAVSPSVLAAGDRGLLLSRPGAANVRPPSMLAETPAVDRYAVPSRPSPLDRDPLAMLPKPTPIPLAPVAPPPVAPPSTTRQTATAAARPVSAAAVVPSVAAAARSVPPAAAPPEPAAAEQVRVNTEELTAQIAGSNLTLRTLEAELDEKHAWSAERLESIVHRLDVVVVKNRDLTLFRDLITPAQQALVGQIASPRPLISQLANRIVEVRSRVQGGDFAGTEAQRQAELRRLDALSTRLGNLAAEK